MEKIPTAEEFVLKDSDGYLAGDYTPKEVYALMIDFAKLHVEEALKAASATDIFWEKFSYTHRAEHDKDSILNSYPLKNIK